MASPSSPTSRQVPMQAMNVNPPNTSPEFIVNVDDTPRNSKVHREPSYSSWNNLSNASNQTNSFNSHEFSFANSPEHPPSPPSRLISSFIHKQMAAGFEPSLDTIFKAENIKRISPSSSSDEGSETPGKLRRRSFDCNSNASFETKSSLLRSRTRSRLMDAPPEVEDAKKSSILHSSNLKSGHLSKPLAVEDDDEDPFKDEDIPDDFKRVKCSWQSSVQWVGLFVVVSTLLTSLLVRRLQKLTVWQLHLWKWELLLLVLISGRLVSGWVIRIGVLLIERNFLLRKRLLYFVYSVRKAVQNCLWLGLVLMSWHFMFDSKVERETNSAGLPYVTKVLFCLLVATLVRLVKTLLVKFLASSFHVNTYFDRIQESVFNQYVVETLSSPPLIEEKDGMMVEMEKLQSAGAKIPNDLKAAAFPSKGGSNVISGQIGRRNNRSSGVIAGNQVDKGIEIDKLMKMNQKNVSAWSMKRLIRIVRRGMLTTLNEQIMDRDSGGDEHAIQIRSEYVAKIAAKKMFHNVARPGAKHIYLVDLMRFMREDEAIKTLSLFEGARESNRISRKAMKNWVINAFKERRALSLTLNDAKTAVNKLHQMANVVVGVIVLGLWLLILGIATTHFFVFLSSQVLLAVFVFGNSLKMVFEAIIFLFVMHPFDVGDRCEVDAVQLIVEEMNILTTVFLRFDNQKITYPNSVLATKHIGNYYRSPDMGEAIDFCVNVATPVEKLTTMRERILGYLESKKDHWYPNPTVVLRDVDDMNRLKISIWMRHRINFQDMGIRFARRELVIQEMIKVLRELDIEYRMLPVDVNVRNMPAVNSSRLPSTWTAFN